MLLEKFLKIVLILFGGVFILLQGLAKEAEGALLSVLILILFTWLYLRFTKHKSKLFLAFLLLFTFAQTLGLFTWFSFEIKAGEINYLYYIANCIYIGSYSMLILKTMRQLNLKIVFSELTIPILVLIVLDVFCVSLISNTTEGVFTVYQYILEYVYNGAVMLLLSIALIDYMYRNNNKSMLFLIGCIFVTFSEIIQLAYFYILSDRILGFVYSSFLVIAFFFFYLQSQHKVTAPVLAYEDEPIEA